MSTFDEPNQPDLSKPLSRWSAPYWAMMNGIAAAIEPAEWSVLCAIYTHLPNVRPGKGRIEKLAGVSPATVKRARKRLRLAGLIDYADGLAGGSGQHAATSYTVADVRVPQVVDSILSRLTGVMMNPVHEEPGSLRTPTGVMMSPHPGHDEPGTGVMMNPEVRNTSSQEEHKEEQEAATPPGPPFALSFQSEVGVQLNENQLLKGPKGEAVGLTASGQEVVGTRTSVESTEARQASMSQELSRQPSVKEGASAKKRKSERSRNAAAPGGKPRLFGEVDDRLVELASKSVKNMEAFLLYGKLGLEKWEQSKSEEELRLLPPAPTNWRQFLTRNPDGSHVLDGNRRPVGYDRFSIPAMLGYYWWTVSNFLSLRGVPLYTPNWSKLLGTVRNQINNYGPGATFDRIVQYGQSYDVIMSLVGRAGDLPGEDSLTNQLVDRAYRQWCALNDYGRREVTERVREAA